MKDALAEASQIAREVGAAPHRVFMNPQKDGWLVRTPSGAMVGRRNVVIQGCDSRTVLSDTSGYLDVFGADLSADDQTIYLRGQ